MAAIRLLVAEKDPFLRSLLGKRFRDEAGIEVVGGVGDGHAAMTHAFSLQPDVLLLDLDLPPRGGLELLRHLAQRADGPPVLVMTPDGDAERALAALGAGARGVLAKPDADESVSAAVRAVASGGVWIEAPVAERLLQELALQSRRRADAEGVDARLTRTEREIYDGLRRGLTNAEIAAEACMSVSTVKRHVGSIFRKLNVRRRTQAVLLTLPPDEDPDRARLVQR